MRNTKLDAYLTSLIEAQNGAEEDTLRHNLLELCTRYEAPIPQEDLLIVKIDSELRTKPGDAYGRIRCIERRKPGRPRKSADGRGNPGFHVRLPAEVYCKIKQLGGVKWIREVLEDLVAIEPILSSGRFPEVPYE